jgi:alpha(1,3/1,4) fucosyltransferase
MNSTIEMKELGFYNYYDEYNNNRIFDPAFISPIGDDLTYPFRYLAEVAKNKEIHISTIDTQPLDTYDAIIFLDFPTYKNRYFKKLIEDKFENLYLFIFENELIRPDNWKKENYRHFKRVYTWNDEIVDNEKLRKFFLPTKIPISVSFDAQEKKKFCCLIAGNKFYPHPLELYSERIRAIRWFEKNEPQCFDLYGKGWNEHSFSGIFRPFNKIKTLKRLASPKYPSYKGEIKSKMMTLKKYKFSICYENARDIPGYITEKIFDCFFAGCVPIYWGAPNIRDFISDNTFIDRSKFESYKELFDFVVHMDEKTYLDYISSIERFVNGPKIHPFSAKNFCEMIFKLLID